MQWIGARYGRFLTRRDFRRWAEGDGKTQLFLAANNIKLGGAAHRQRGNAETQALGIIDRVAVERADR